MANKTQTELEQPAKVYQLNAVENKLDHALKQLDTIVNQTSGLATTQQLEEVKKITKEYTDDEITKVRIEYKPIIIRVNAITGTLVTAVVLQLIYILFNLFGGK